MKNKILIGNILAIFTIIIWGSTFIASKILLANFSPVQIMFMRFLIAYIVLWLLKPSMPKLKRSDEFIFLCMGFFGCSLYFFAENTALIYTSTSNCSIIVASAPILTAILAHFFTKDEYMRTETIIGFILAFLGVALVVFNGTVILKLNPLGDILSFAAAFTWAIYSILLKNHITLYNPFVITRKVTFYGILTSLPFIFFSGGFNINYSFLFNHTTLFCLMFLAVLGSGICYVTWNIATNQLGIVATNNYIYLNPFITMVAAKIFLDEKISYMGIMGAILIIGGVFICNKCKFKKQI